GQSLSARTLFVQQTVTRTGARIVSIGVDDLRLVLRAGTPVDPADENDPSVIAWIDGISGAFVMTQAGVAGQISIANQEFELGDVTLSFQSMTLLFNTGSMRLTQTFVPDAATSVVDVPAGRSFRLELLGARLSFGTGADAVALEGSLSIEQSTRCTVAVTTGTCPTANRQSITKFGLAGFSIVTGTGADEERYLDVSGALVMLPDLDGGGNGVKGIAGVLSAHLALDTGAVDISGSITVKINTTRIAVNETVTVGDQVIRVQTGPGQFEIGVSDAKITIGDFLTIEGSVSFDSSGAFRGSGLLLFVGSGPYRLDDGSVNPNAIGLLISNARIDLRKVTTGATTGYALLADGDLSILGIPGLELDVDGLYVRLNTTGQLFVGANRLRLDDLDGTGTDSVEVTHEFATADVVLDFGATLITFGIGGLIQISGGVRFSKRPTGAIDISLQNASIKLDLDSGGDFANPDINIGGSANFSIGGPEGFKLQSFKVNSFNLFGESGQVQTQAPPRFQPTADLKSPFTGAVLGRATFNGQGYIDVQFNDLNNVGIDANTIIDPGAEFDLRINGQLASSLGIVVNGAATAVPGLRNVFRYTITGAIPEAGEISVTFIAGSFADKGATPSSNATETEYFTLVNPLPNGTLPPAGPVGQLANPVSGSGISLTQINGQRYIDVTFVSRSGAAIDESSINGDEFTLSGAITADLIMLPGTGGIPDIIGTPLKIGANTYRYYLRVNKPIVPVGGVPAGTPAPTTNPFTTGQVTVTFRAGSFRTVDGGLNVERRETFTINPGQAGETTTGGSIELGPLLLQGPTVGIADFGFKDGLVVLTIAVGVNLASLQFGSNSSGATAQTNSGVQVNLLGVLGTFDLAIDVFGLLGGNFHVELPGRWTLNVQSLEVIVPNVVTITAEGIAIGFDPANTDPNQQLLRLDEAVIQFQQIPLRGRILTFDPTPNTPGDEIPGLRIRRNGFDLGVLELCYGCAALPTTTSTGSTGATLPPPQAATTTTGSTTDKIRIGSILEFDDIRVIIENFSFTIGDTFTFSGSIAIASGGAKLFPGNATFNATITDRVSADDRRNGRDDTEALRLQLNFDDQGRVEGFVFEIDTL
ncbi:MAG TPA: hypothetical protein VFD53_04535, partial [Ilumatobacter sp.]|nr:hypothetical protein [Ilumatobacter sp.]